MLLDYLKNLLTFRPHSVDLSNREKMLMSVINQRHGHVNDEQILARLNDLKRHSGQILNKDYGAGSKHQKGDVKSIRKIARYASIKPKYGRLYANLIKTFEFKKCIELGTSFGIGTSYLALNANDIITIEGCQETAKIAEETFRELKLENIDMKVAEFSHILEDLKSELSNPTFVYIDGNHKYEPTIQYFNFFSKHCHEDSVLIFDDIYWSQEMKQAWLHIKEQSYFSVDLYKVGIVLLAKRTESKALKSRY